MSSEWDDLSAAVEGHRPERHAGDFAAWELQLLRAEPAEPEPERQPWWVCCGISRTTAVMACLLPFAAFVTAVLTSGGH